MEFGIDHLFIPYETINDCFREEGLLGIGFDTFFNLHCGVSLVTLLFIKNEELNKYLKQTYRYIIEETFNGKLAQILSASGQGYSPYYLRIIAVSWIKYSNNFYDLIVLYDFNHVEKTLLDHINENKLENKNQIDESFLWKLIKGIVDSAFLFGANHYQYMNIHPLTIFVSKKAVDQKFLIGNHGIYLPSSTSSTSTQSDKDIFQHINTKEINYSNKDLVVLKKQLEQSFLYKLALLVLYLIDDVSSSDLEKFSKSIFNLSSEVKGVQNKAKLLLKQRGFSHQMLSFVYECLEPNPDNRPTLQKLIKDNPMVYFVREEVFYEGITGRNSFKYKGFVMKSEKKASVKDLKEKEKDIFLPQGLGIIDNMIIGEFMDMKTNGLNLSFTDKEIVWGCSREDNEVTLKGSLIRKGLFFFFGTIEKKTNQILQGLIISITRETR
jgi:hypothetical protein